MTVGGQGGRHWGDRTASGSAKSRTRTSSGRTDPSDAWGERAARHVTSDRDGGRGRGSDLRRRGRARLEGRDEPPLAPVPQDAIDHIGLGVHHDNGKVTSPLTALRRLATPLESRLATCLARPATCPCIRLQSVAEEPSAGPTVDEALKPAESLREAAIGCKELHRATRRSGAPERARTVDIQLGKLTLYHIKCWHTKDLRRRRKRTCVVG